MLRDLMLYTKRFFILNVQLLMRVPLIKTVLCQMVNGYEMKRLKIHQSLQI
jgi:hypothetical protein